MLRFCVTGLLALLVTGTTFVPSAAAEGDDSVGLSGTIAFQTVSGGAIYAVDVETLTGTGGSNLRYLTTGMDPALSPDGQWVAFTRWDVTQHGAFGSLWVINVDGSGERAILGDIHQPKAPTWSADGTQIVISMQHGGRLQAEDQCSSGRPPQDAFDVRVVREDDGDIKFCYTLPPHPFWGLRVVDVASGEFEDLPNDLFSYSPTWDPTNAWHLVYDGEQGLVNLDLSQGTTWALTDDGNDRSPVFSPDGTQVAVSYWQNDHWEIHVINADGTGRVRLTETSVQARLEQMVSGDMPTSWNNVAPTWSPDGSQIAFLTDRTGQWEIWIMPAPGAQAHVTADTLTGTGGSNPRPLVTAEMLDGIMLQYNGVDERMLSWR
jgi:TolB protein